MGYENLRVERRDQVALVTVDRPSRLNALDGKTLAELDQVFAALAGDDEVRAVVVTGAGEKAFVAGADIEELRDLDAESGQALSRRGQRVFDRIEWLGKPVVAAVNGFALGGGCELALACHVRLASENASLGTPEVKLGLMCGYGGTQRLPRLIGRGAALEMLLTGERVGAQEALRLGLVDRVVPREALVAEAFALARKMAEGAPLAHKAILEAVHGGLDQPLAQAQEGEAQLFGELAASEDAHEGTGAFLEKRKPQFRGR